MPTNQSVKIVYPNTCGDPGAMRRLPELTVAKVEVPPCCVYREQFSNIRIPECESDELICPSLPSEQPVFEVERHLAKSHGCEPKEAIEIILRIGVDVCDCHVVCAEITLTEQHLSRKPPDMSPSANSGGY